MLLLVLSDSNNLDIIGVIKDEVNDYLKFERFIEEEINKIKVLDKNNTILRIVIAPEFQNNATILYNKIMESKDKSTFSVPHIQTYLSELYIKTPKAALSRQAKELYGEKTDIIITSDDSLDHTKSTLGFSIKSQFGSKPTLFNCSATSGFVYKIEGCTEEDMYELNSLENCKLKLQTINNEDKYSLKYIGCRNNTFKQNISIVDSQMDKILSTLTLIHFISTSPADYHLDKLIDINPISVGNPQIFYVAKLKEFIFDSFAGMTASREWNGRKKITGGYIDVAKDGNMLYYRAISDDVFGNYLYVHTKMDSPQQGYKKDLAYAEAVAHREGRELTKEESNAIIYTNGISGLKKSPKGDYGYVYCKDNEYYIDINFQIRTK